MPHNYFADSCKVAVRVCTGLALMCLIGTATSTPGFANEAVKVSRQQSLPKLTRILVSDALDTGKEHHQSIRVAVLGEVNRVGAYTLAIANDSGAAPTVTQAIQSAGGITVQADVRQVVVRRLTQSGGTQMLRVNLFEFLQSNDQSQDIALQDGDVVIVSPVR